MANVITTQVILDGPRNCVLKVEGILDTSDLAYQTILDPATLQGVDWTGAVKAQGFLIRRITYMVEDTLEARLFWDATTPTRIEELTGRGVAKYENFGGLTNNSGAGRTGKIGLSTEGWAAAKILSFSLIFELVKQGTL